jgi:Protein of unknown function (DUF1344)
MTGFLRCALVVLLLVVPAISFAAEVQGKVRAIDPGDRVVTLEDGTRITVPQEISLDALTEGSEITVSYEERDGKNQATNIQMR